jgi:hypothetical protein
MKHIRLAVCAGLGALALAGSTLSGCGDKCAGINCAPCSTSPNDIVVVFDRDSLRGGFRKAELSGAYAVVYAGPGFAAPLDTVHQARGKVDFYWGFVSLATLPWAANKIQPPYPESYNFRFVLPNAGRTYDFSNIELQTGPSGNSGGCCGDCGQNTRRRFLLNGVPVVADGAEFDGRGATLRR